MSSNFRYQPFVAVSENLGGKVLVVEDVLWSHKQEHYPTTSLHENCSELEFQMDGNYYVDLRQTFLALKLNLVRGRGYEICNSKDLKKEHKEEATADDEATADEEREAPVPPVTHVNNILHSIFSKFEVFINNQQIYNSIGLYAHKSFFPTTSSETFLKTREFCTARGTTTENFWMKLWKLHCLNLFSQGE